MVKTIKDIFSEAASLNDYLNSRGINPKFVSRDTKISHAKSALFQKWKSDRKMSEETISEASETELLAKYLNSRGINAKYATKDMKIAHSKSGEFMKWKRDHQHLELGEEVVAEETDKKDMICMDIPLLIRVLEFTREDMKSDIELHNMVERLINMRETYPLTMKEYDAITSNLVKEDVQLNEDNLDSIAKKHGMEFNRTTYGAGMKHPTKGEISINRYGEWHHTGTKAQGDSTDKFASLDKHLSTLKEETLDEAKKPRTTALEKWRKAAKERENKHNQTKTKGMEDAITKLSQHLNKENTLDSMAATEAPSDCSDNTNSTPTAGKSYASKMVKSLKKTVKEETYDWEKDDKSSQEKPYGKAPKMNVTDKTGTLGDTKPEARAVMKGGKTLTGQPRDMVEIDPSMKQRPGQQDKGQSTFTSPIAKKSP